MTTASINEVKAAGVKRLFDDQTYHFQALRVLSDATVGAADVAETLQTISRISAGDESTWYQEFSNIAIQSEKVAATCKDKLSSGLAYHRAHTYWRTAEFLLKPDDARRNTAWKRQISNFNLGLETLNIAHEHIAIPYEDGMLKGIYYPAKGGEKKPLIVVCGGFDGTLEELYFFMGKSGNDRGYNVLTYEGPGQGAPLREHNMYFTHEWEKPTSAMLNSFLATHSTPDSIILMGVSLGGYLAPRAAAFDDRIDGVIALDIMYDFGAVIAPFRQLAQDPVMSQLSGVRWALDNGRWVFGKTTNDEFIDETANYKLEGISHKIKGDVLILAGETDHFVPVEQVGQFTKALTNARSVESVIYDAASGGGEHCQLGAVTLWQATTFDWIARHFG